MAARRSDMSVRPGSIPGSPTPSPMALSANGQAAAFSARKPGFDSLWGYFDRPRPARLEAKAATPSPWIHRFESGAGFLCGTGGHRVAAGFPAGRGKSALVRPGDRATNDSGPTSRAALGVGAGRMRLATATKDSPARLKTRAEMPEVKRATTGRPAIPSAWSLRDHQVGSTDG